jgi:2-C-methyl-D-erythritol 4-phosphate cytidylyltransferase
MRDVGVVIVAGGSSARTAGDELKQFRWIAGKPMLLHSLQAFMARADVCSVVCVVPQQYVADPPPWIFQCDVDRLLLSVGGRTRTESARNGLEDLPNEATIALIHDAARPLVDDAAVDRVIAAARAGHCVVPGLPVVDTIKEVDGEGRVTKTLDRERLWRVHREARATNATATDDAALCERIGIAVSVVPGSERSMKVTHESDFQRVEALFAAAAAAAAITAPR